MRTLFPAVFLATASQLCTATEEPLIYEESCWVDAELRVTSPCGKWEVVYAGYRHLEKTALQRVTTVTLVHKDGQQFLLEANHSKSSNEVVLKPWSPDGKWLAIQAWPKGTAGFRFYPVDRLPQALMNGGLCLEVSLRGSHLFCEQGAWAADGSFRFLAGLSGDYAPYRADVAEDKVEVQRLGEFRKLYPGQSTNKP